MYVANVVDGRLLIVALYGGTPAASALFTGDVGLAIDDGTPVDPAPVTEKVAVYMDDRQDEVVVIVTIEPSAADVVSV